MGFSRWLDYANVEQIEPGFEFTLPYLTQNIGYIGKRFDEDNIFGKFDTLLIVFQIQKSAKKMNMNTHTSV